MRRRIFLGLIAFLVLACFFSVLVYYNFLSHHHIPVTNIDMDRVALISDSDLDDYELVKTILLPLSPEELQMVEEGKATYDDFGGVFNYYRRKDSDNGNGNGNGNGNESGETIESPQPFPTCSPGQVRPHKECR